MKEEIIKIKPKMQHHPSQQAVHTYPNAMSGRDAATYIGKSHGWVKRARLEGTGPVYRRIGRQAIYLKKDLDAFLDSCIVNPLEQPNENGQHY